MNEKQLYRTIRALRDEGLSFAKIAKELAPELPNNSVRLQLYRFYMKNRRIRNNALRLTLGMDTLVTVQRSMVRSAPPQPPRKLTRCTFYRTTPVDKILDDLERVTGITFEVKGSDT